MTRPIKSYIFIKVILDLIIIFTIIYAIQNQVPEVLFLMLVFFLVWHQVQQKTRNLLKRIILRFKRLEYTMLLSHLFLVIVLTLISNTMKFTDFDFIMLGFLFLLSLIFQFLFLLEVKDLRYGNKLTYIYSKSTYALIKIFLGSYLIESIILCFLFFIFFFVANFMNIDFLSPLYIFVFCIFLIFFLLLYTRKRSISEIFLKYKINANKYLKTKIFLSYVFVYFLILVFILLGFFRLAGQWGYFLPVVLLLVDILGCVIPSIRTRSTLYLLKIEFIQLK